jgi:nucleotide-binding universal stress UspA family protein
MGPTARRSRASDAAVRASSELHSLLVPIDLTPSSDRVLGRLALLPLAADARVTLLHVVPASLPRGEQRRAERDARNALASEVRHLRKQLPKKVRLDTSVQAGSPARVIAEDAAKARPELIAMGRGGGGTLRDSFLGSTAERVLRQARLPVLVVRLAPRAAYRRPALALDLDEAAHEAVRLLLLVLPPPRPPPACRAARPTCGGGSRLIPPHLHDAVEHPVVGVAVGAHALARAGVDVIHALQIPYEDLVYPSLSGVDVEERKDELRTDATREVTKLLAAALAAARVPPHDEPSWSTRVH